MTPVYEVRTKHTDQVLKDFITFREAARNIHITFRLVVLSICSLTLAALGKGTVLTYIFAVIAVIILAFTAVRKRIAFSKLAKADVNYEKKSEIHFIFGESEFRVDNPDAGDEQRIKYGEVEFMYADDNYFYINVNNDDLHMIPKGDFTLGDAEGFYDFFMHKTGKIFQPLKLSWKMKADIFKQALAETREENSKKYGK